MRAAARFFADMLPLDDAGRRAIDEALADWRHEAETAMTIAGRVIVAVRHAAGLMLVLGLLTFRDLGRPHTPRLTASSMLTALVVTLFLAAQPMMEFAAELLGRDVPLLVIAGLLVMLLPQALAVSMPLALLTPPGSRYGGRSLLGLCLLLAALSFVNLGWGIPNANQNFREKTFALLNASAAAQQVVPNTRIPRGINEYTVTDLLRGSRQPGPEGRRTIQALNNRLMLFVMVPICLLIGSQAGRVVRAKGWKRGAGPLAWSVLFAGYVISTGGAGGAYEVLVRWNQLEVWNSLVTYRPLLLPLVSLSGAVALAWSARRLEREAANLIPA